MVVGNLLLRSATTASVTSLVAAILLQPKSRPRGPPASLQPRHSTSVETSTGILGTVQTHTPPRLTRVACTMIDLSASARIGLVLVGFPYLTPLYTQGEVSRNLGIQIGLNEGLAMFKWLKSRSSLHAIIIMNRLDVV